MQHLSAATENRRGLQITFGLTFTYSIIEMIGGILTGSLALLADAAHMFTDVVGLGLVLFAIWMAQKPATAKKA
jgi:cobalt-zinc-cadmium efflux system protein